MNSSTCNPKSGADPVTRPAPAPAAGEPGVADLHLHTRFSDGTFTPEELAQRGAQAGLKAMALTDHDTVEGCEPMGRACQALGVEFIVGTELTAEIEGSEVHLLGYFLDPSNAALLGEIKKFQEVRRNRIYEMVARINRLNIPLQPESVFALANCRSPGRPHVGRALVKAGHCATLDEAFDRFLKKGRPAWVPKFKMSALDGIELIHQAGGLAVMAHPGLNHNDDLIPLLADQKLDGLECFHSRHNHSMSEHYLRLAAHCQLLVTGGSDCHGFSKGKPLVGTVRLARHHFDLFKQAGLRRTGEAKS